MGKTVSEETKNVKAWDSNAITPGTPFMVLLAESLRYWVVKKLNSDPGWKNVSQLLQGSYLSTDTFSSCKSSFPMPASLARVNIKSWISFVASAFRLTTIPIPNTLSMVW
jgi:hypothetical protein